MGALIRKGHNVSILMYHFVFVAKYRRLVITEEVDKVLKQVCIEISKRYEIRFLEIRESMGNTSNFISKKWPINNWRCFNCHCQYPAACGGDHLSHWSDNQKKRNRSRGWYDWGWSQRGGQLGNWVPVAVLLYAFNIRIKFPLSNIYPSKIS